MVYSAVTISLVPEAKGGPFVFWDGLAPGCAQAGALGFDGVEIFPPSAEGLDRALLRRLLAEHRLRVAAFGTGAGWVLHRLSLTDVEPTTRARARGFIRGIIELAGEFGAPAIIGSMQGRVPSGVARALALDWLGEALEELGGYAAGRGVSLLLEPLNRYETNLLNTVGEGVEMLRRLETQSVKLLGDLFHQNIEEHSISEALRASGPALGHVHLADSNRRPAGNGHTDFTAAARALRDIGYTGFVSAEALPYPTPEQAARDSIAAFHRYFRPE